MLSNISSKYHHKYYLLQWIRVIMACVHSGIPFLYLQEGQTVLYTACAYYHLEIVKMLLEYGAQVNKVNSVSDFNLLYEYSKQ